MTDDPAVLASEIARLRVSEEARRIEAEATAVTVPWPKDRPRYAVTVYLRERADEFECVSFAVTSLRPGTSVGTAVMRDLQVATLVRGAVRQVLVGRLASAERDLEYVPDVVVHTHHGVEGTTTEAGPPDEEFQKARRGYWEPRRNQAAALLARATGEGKGRRYPAGHLEEVARIVRQARKGRDSAQAAVMEAFDIKRSAAANQIARAKARGLLDPETEED